MSVFKMLISPFRSGFFIASSLSAREGFSVTSFRCKQGMQKVSWIHVEEEEEGTTKDKPPLGDGPERLTIRSWHPQQQ